MSVHFEQNTVAPRYLIPRLVSATILVVGVAIVWVITWGMGTGFLGSLLGKPRSVSEQLSLLRDGTPIIASQEDYGERTSYRTLDGKPLELTDQQDYLYYSNLPAPPKEPALLEEPRSWSDRILVASDYANPRTFWFAIRSPERQGYVYWQGINYFSKETVGFVSKGGFSQVLPQTEDCFQVNPAELCTSTGYLTTNDYLYVNQKADLSAEPANWIVFQFDTDRVWRIDLRKKTVELFRETPGIISMVMVDEPSWLTNQTANEQNEAPERKVKRTDLEDRLAMRFADRIDVWNPRTDETVSYPLPIKLRDESLSVMGLGQNRLLLLSRAGFWQHGYLQRIDWLENEVGATRTETVQLAGYRQPSPRSQAWQVAPVVPIPVAWGFVEGVLHPLSLLNERKASTYFAALSQSWQETWPALTTVLAVSAALAWFAYRRQQQLFSSDAKLWTLFVFLAGVPGWIAWRIMHPKPPLEPCPQCGTMVPRDRTSCAKCAESFPEPELTGIEVFA